MKQDRDERHEQRLGDREQSDDAEHLAEIYRGARRGRQQQRAQRLGVPFALERLAERERAPELDRDPEDAGRGIEQRFPFFDERDRKDQHAGQGEEERRVQNLAAPDFNRDVLLQHEERGSDEHSGVPHHAAVARAQSCHGRLVREQPALPNQRDARD